MGGRSSKSKKSNDAEPTAPLDVLVEGAIVFLTSKASGKLLRVHEGNVDAQGEEGESAQFTVSKKDSESGHVVTLQHGEKYLSVSEEKVELCDESSELKVLEAEGCVSFESAKAAGHYISVQEDGSVQSGSELGPSTHFTVASAVKKEEAAPAENAEAAKEEGQETNAVAETEEKREEQAEQKESKEPKQEEGQEEQSPSES